MHRTRSHTALIVGTILAVLVSGTAFAQIAPTNSTSSLEAQRALRAQQLQDVNAQLQQTQGQLSSIQAQKNSLQKEVLSLDTTIKQLNLNIQSDQLTSAQLADDIGGLQAKLADTAAEIDGKKAAVGAALQELQQQDNDGSFLVTLLGGHSLTEGLADVQSLGSLRIQLTSDIDSLNDLSNQYTATVNDLSGKRNDVAVHQENLANRKAIIADQQAARAAVLAETKSQESVYQQKVKALQAQQEALDNEIAKIEAQLKASLNPNVLPTRDQGLFAWPLQNVHITQYFGEVSSLYHGKPHNGIDLAASIGTPVMAAADGVVLAVGNNDQSATRRYQYGKYVLLKHDNNLDTIYGHLSRQVVVAGEAVKKGQIIGYSGSTGYATGPHLHFGVYYAPTVTLQSLPPAAGLVPVGAVLNGQNYLPPL